MKDNSEETINSMFRMLSSDKNAIETLKEEISSMQIGINLSKQELAQRKQAVKELEEKKDNLQKEMATLDTHIGRIHRE